MTIPPQLDGEPFCPGELCLLVDSKGRRHLLRLDPAATFHSHAGTLSHSRLIGKPPGSRVRTTGGLGFVAVRPRPKDFVLEMPRGAQVVYPKDFGPMLLGAGIRCGFRVLEIGFGSGSLAIATLLAVGESGSLVSVERRRDHAERGLGNLEAFFGSRPRNHYLVVGDATACLTGRPSFDACLIDVAEPWTVVGVVHSLLRSGGYLASYSPSALQVARTVDALELSGFGLIDVVEVLERHWQARGSVLRPEHRMVAHTGFVTTAVKLAPCAESPAQ